MAIHDTNKGYFDPLRLSFTMGVNAPSELGLRKKEQNKKYFS